ncbi:PAAR-like domain-containing protein [Vibrio hepatarius]|uniref:PAAR-like domain-containing protein n=1 Tax=Vibrio hepatarius TaxID=171383 RepID=UPI001C0A2763|nr:PAAR-like domain-containing protein [Vibrio hepatarius]MBU2898632.1 DUF4150 domain-containing protein [Vibrio hepatarius]
MPVTINANGLSIVHKGSGGEANATLPDVCLTTVGPAVVRISYGNNAKSADLVDGTTTVSADGGNSIAIKGSKFAVSTGDADGDQKGASSGTIEDEAEFISASANVIIEGKGVSRLTDQMTMNKANTMCLGGVQNPSVTVDPTLDVPSAVDIRARYPNGKLLTNAPYVLTDEGITPLGAGVLDGTGESYVSGLKPGKIKVVMEESQDAFCLSPVRRTNPHCIEDISDDDFFDKARKRNQGFWQPTRVETGLAPWGAIGHELTSDRYFQDIIELETRLHFSHLHPATEFSLEKSCDTLVGNLNMPLPHTTEAMLAYSMPMILEEGEILSAILRLAPYETTDRMLAYIRARGQGNPQSYLNNYDWAAAKKAVNESFDSLLKKLQSRLEFLRDQASKLKYAYLSDDLFKKHIDTIKAYGKGLTELIAGVFAKMQLRASTLMSNTANVKVIKAADNVYSAEAGTIETVVNTTQTVDLVEPFMNEVPGKIADVLPIYPVRYGYANFFDTIMPAQAPPTLPEMASASGLNETGGYILRLLREGWIYIKEEEGKADNEQIHIFRYAQTETATGVIEKFEKYYFTNEENAQDGLTLDTSSGATFYPFAFVTNGTKKISIAYSEHEWAADIIDKMNSDLEWRTKAMQQVDMTASDDFSDTATQGTLSSLVEDYRSHDEKWLADKEAQKPTDIGMDIVTTQRSYHLVADELVETMQKSHSEKKDGTLVVLFDPVGRQLDIANKLRMTVAEGQAYQQNNLYPLTIGTYAKACMDSEVPEVSAAAQENLDTQALTDFINQSKTQKEDTAKEIQQWLDIMHYYVAGEGAKNELGSLPFYLHNYFDLRQEGIVKPIEELAKLFFLLGTLFDGVTASEEGMETMDDWVGQAFATAELTPTDNVLGIMFKGAKMIFTQCQGSDWRELSTDVSKYVLISLGNFLARIPVAFSYVGQHAGKWANIAANAGLENFYRTTLPDIFDAMLGVKINGKRVPVSLDDIEALLEKQANTGKAAALWQKTKTNWHERLLDWSEVKADAKEQRIFQLLELEITPSSPKEVKGFFEKSKVKTSLHITGGVVDVGFAAWSFYYNVLAMYDLASQQEYAELDPINDKDTLYDLGKMGSTLMALAADSAALTQYGAKSANATASMFNRGLGAQAVQKYLPNLSSKLASKLRLANIMAYSQHMDTQLAKVPIRGLVAVANIGVAAVYFADAFTANRSGNNGLRDGHLIGAAASLLMLGTLASGPIGWACFAVAMAGLFWSGYTISRFQKSDFENLLFSCFWGKSKYYSFWEFSSSKKISTIDGRFTYLRNELRELKNFFDAAFRVESQEFINYFYWPQLKVDRDTSSQGILSAEQLCTFRFILPEFKMGISQLHGTMCNTFISRSGTSTVVANEAMTTTFKQALLAALNNPEQHQLKEDGLHLTVVAKFPVGLGISPSLPTLKWCYEPEPALVVPKRMLTSSGSIDGHMIGMLDERPNDKY